MNAPDALQNIRSKHPVAYVVLYLFVGWALLVVITHAIAFGAELLIASSDQPVVKWETTDECTDGTRTIYHNSHKGDVVGDLAYQLHVFSLVRMEHGLADGIPDFPP